MTLGDEWAYDWFHDSHDKKFKTIQDLLHDFLGMFGHDRDEIYSELVDDFVEKWKRKNLLAVEITSSDIKIDAPSNTIEEIQEVIQNMHLPQEEQCETMNEQLAAIEDQFEGVEANSYIEY
jgi:hypothetical protein